MVYGISIQTIKQWKYCCYIWSIDSEKLCFILILKEKNNNVLIFNIVRFPNFEISASLLLAPHLTFPKFNGAC